MRRIGVTGQKALDESRQNDQRRNPDHHFHAPPSRKLKSPVAGVSIRKCQPSTHREARCSGHNDARNFDGTVNPNGEKRFQEQAFFHKKVLEYPNHNAIKNEDNYGAHPNKHSGQKGQQRHHQVIEGDAKCHIEHAFLLVHRHGVAIFDVAFGHVQIALPQNDFWKIGIHGTGKYPNAQGECKYQESHQHVATSLEVQLRQFLQPKMLECSPGRSRAFVYVVKNALRQAIEVYPHRAVGVKRSGIRQVICDLDKQIIELIGVFVFILQDVFKLAPLFLVLLNKLGFAHSWVLQALV